MATLRDIKRKIGSINSTQTITRTMKMVSASKLRRAQEELEKIREYAVKLEALTDRIIAGVDPATDPLLAEKEEVKNVLIVAIASDRGLCGAFNTGIGLHVENYVREYAGTYENISVAVFGRKLKDYLQRRKVNVVKDWTDVRLVDMAFVEEMAAEIIDFYISGGFDKIDIIYTYFKSPIKQEVIFEDFIPVKASAEVEPIDYICEPDRDKIIKILMPRYVTTKLFYSLVESQTSEHAARMSTMENATNNCGEMMRYLTLVYNKRRQESITSEMLDIVGGAEALRGT